MKVLVIDDEKPTLSMFKLFLAAYGYDVFTAEDGEKGLELYKETSPDIVFTDIKMPGIDGLEVLRRIRKTSSETQVVIITGHGDMEKAVEALDMDASDFINKPVERAALNSALTRAEKRRQLPLDQTFQLEAVRKGPILELQVRGKLTESAGPLLMSSIESNAKPDDIQHVHVVLDDTFSINRSGITLLIEMIQACIRMALKVCIKQISYNYTRVFQMAGIDKMAQLEEAEIVE